MIAYIGTRWYILQVCEIQLACELQCEHVLVYRICRQMYHQTACMARGTPSWGPNLVHIFRGTCAITGPNFVYKSYSSSAQLQQTTSGTHQLL